MAKQKAGSITEFVMRQPLFGAHSHIMSVTQWAEERHHFSMIQGYAHADLVTAAGPTAIGESPLPPLEDKGFTKRYFELWGAPPGAPGPPRAPAPPRAAP